MKKKFVTFALLPAVAIAAAGATVATQVGAHGGSAHIEQLADKLDLTEAQVEAAFAEIKAEHRAEFEAKKAQRATNAQTKYEERLQKAVDNGDLTEAQKQLIISKRAELVAKWQQEHADLEAWSETNNIDMKYLFGHKGFHGHHKTFLKMFQQKSDD